MVGNEEILSKLLPFDSDGKIEKLDAFGAAIKETKTADISADELIDNYAMALTGTSTLKAAIKKAKAIKSYVRVSEISSAQIPFALSSTDYFWDGSKEASKMEMPGMVLQKSYFDGTSGYTFSMQGGREDLKAEEISAKQKASGLIPELNYKSKGMTYEIKGIENIDGEDCYVLYTTDGLSESFDYFSNTSFMKLRTTNLRKMED